MTLSDRTISPETLSLWEQTAQDSFPVPERRTLSDLTSELTAMLADPDPHVRDELAFTTLSTWINRGEYDDLLVGLGDGMAAGLRAGLGEPEGDGVFRRSFSALVLAACIERDTVSPSVPDTQILIWGDHLVTWLLGEADLRSFVPEKGWAHAVAHGADAIGALGASPHLGAPEQQMMLEVVAERLVAPTEHLFVTGEPDRCADAVLRILRRDDLSAETLEPWVASLTARATRDPRITDPRDQAAVRTANVQAFLRALFIHLSLASPAPAVRADLLLMLIDVLKSTNTDYFDPHHEVGSSLPS